MNKNNTNISDSGTSLTGALLRGLLNGASFGLADEGKDLLHKIAPSTFDNGDKLRANYEEDAQDHPYASTAGNIAGGILDGLIPVAGEASLARAGITSGRAIDALNALKQAPLTTLVGQGAAQGVGDSNTLTNPYSTNGDVAQNALKGAVTSALLGTVANKILGGVANKVDTGSVLGKDGITTNPFVLSQSNNPLVRSVGDFMINRIGNTQEGKDLVNEYARMNADHYESMLNHQNNVQMTNKGPFVDGDTPNGGDTAGHNFVANTIQNLSGMGPQSLTPNNIKANLSREIDKQGTYYEDTPFLEALRRASTTPEYSDAHDYLVQQVIDHDSRPYLKEYANNEYLNNSAGNRNRLVDNVHTVMNTPNSTPVVSKPNEMPAILGSVLAGPTGAGIGALFEAIRSGYLNNMVNGTSNRLAKSGIKRDIDMNNVANLSPREQGPANQVVNDIRGPIVSGVTTNQNNNNNSPAIGDAVPVSSNMDDILRKGGWSQDQIDEYNRISRQ